MKRNLALGAIASLAFVGALYFGPDALNEGEGDFERKREDPLLR